jgi:hypothetical protein
VRRRSIRKSVLATSASGGETADAQPDHRERLGFEAMPARAKLALDVIEHLVGFLDTTMRHQPARRFGQPQPHQEDDEPEHRADEEGQAPSQIRRQHGWIKQYDRGCRPERSADPKAAVNNQIGPTAISCGYQLLNR